MKAYDSKLTRIYKDGMFYIEITQLTDVIEVLIWHEDYGDRMHCFSLDAGELTFNQVEIIVEANLWNYKHLYATRYMDHERKEDI